jgi:hypothetical protein
MPILPAGMSNDTFQYVVAFTLHHEGDTPFMYNNYPLKSPHKDVTAGVGISLVNADAAASPEIRAMFTVRITGQPATDPEMRKEFKRVYDIDRTADNLHTDFEAPSPLQMDRGSMLRKLNDKLLTLWGQSGMTFPNFETIPAQAQVALMSYNYGARLRSAPKMCAAVLAADYETAAKESLVPGWDGQKNAAHNRLFTNAAILFGWRYLRVDMATLPPLGGPFKPPPYPDKRILPISVDPRMR